MNTITLFGSECSFINTTYFDGSDIQAMIKGLEALVLEITGESDLTCKLNEITVGYCSGVHMCRADTIADEDDQSLNLFVARKQLMFESTLEQLAGLGAPDSAVPAKVSLSLALQTLEVMLEVIERLSSHAVHYRMYEMMNRKADRNRYYTFPHPIAEQLITSRLGNIKIGIHSKAESGAFKRGKLISAKRRITRTEHRLSLNRMERDRLTNCLAGLEEDIHKREMRLEKLKRVVAELSNHFEGEE